MAGATADGIAGGFRLRYLACFATLSPAGLLVHARARRGADVAPVRAAMAIAARVALTLVDADKTALDGRLVRALPGYFGLLRYVLALDAPLPRGFDPLGELSPLARLRRVRHLLLTPAPDLPTLATPPDVIGDRVMSGTDIRVFVSIGPDPATVPLRTWRRLPEHRYPFLCMGDLRAAAGSVGVKMRPCADLSEGSSRSS